jgi:ribosomal protein S8
MIKKINTNWYCNLINLIKLSYCMRQDYIYIKFVKKLLPILNLLVRVNYINSYKILTDNTLIIYLVYRNKKSVWNNVKLYYRQSRYTYINIHRLKKFHYNEFNKLMIISSPRGIITHEDALKYNVGGKLLFVLF